MLLTVCNGSPRGTRSNTAILTDSFLAGFSESGNKHEKVFLACEEDRTRALTLFGKSDMFMLAFPIYNDAMPSIVKEFIESLVQFQGKEGNPSLLFMVQCGFLGSSNMSPVAAYLEKLTKRLGCNFAGIIRKDGVEGIQAKPLFFTRRLFMAMHKLGQDLGTKGKLEEKELRSIAKPEHYPQLTLKIFNKLAEYVYWYPQYKRNGTFKRRFDRPYDFN